MAAVRPFAPIILGATMKAVITEVPEHMLAERKRTGADRWDEMWKGVLHMAAAPHKRHSRLQVQLHNWLDVHWARPGGNQVDLLINVASAGGWPHDYRIPDIVLLTPDRFAIDRDEYYDGAPTVVVEIRSPGDETWDKMEFYASIGVPEVWVVDRDTKTPQMFLLAQGGYVELQPAADHWLRSPATGVWMRGGAARRLEVQMGEAAATRRALPQE
jgi:Uma2 family endonuclease